MARIQRLDAARAAARESARELLERHRDNLSRAVSTREVHAILGTSVDDARKDLNARISRKMHAKDLLDDAVRDVIGGFVTARLDAQARVEDRAAVREGAHGAAVREGAYREPPKRSEAVRLPRKESPAARAEIPSALAPVVEPVVEVEEDDADHSARRGVGAALLICGVLAFALLSSGFHDITAFSLIFGGGLFLCGWWLVLFPLSRNSD